MASPETSVKIARDYFKPNPERLIADAIWQDVMDRRDIGQMLRSCDPGTKLNILESWRQIAEIVLKEARNAD